MDIATVSGIIVAYALVIGSLVIGAGLGTYIDIPSVMIVVGGTIGIVLVNFPLSNVLGAMGPLLKAFLYKSTDLNGIVDTLVKYAVKARRDGILALETAVDEVSEPLMKTGLQMVVDGEEPNLVRGILETDLDNREERHKIGVAIFESIGAYAPAMGMIGTLIGLVAMLKTMNDPSTIGPSMATALITTFYGAIISNMFALPIAGKLSLRASEESMAGQLIIDGIMSIQSGDNPRMMEQKLQAFIAPKKRVSQFNK